MGLSVTMLALMLALLVVVLSVTYLLERESHEEFQQPTQPSSKQHGGTT
jgi:hypothetical protein